MLNPYESPENALKKRAHLHMNNKSVPTQINTLMKDTFAGFLQVESIVLTRNEKRRLFQIVAREIFDDILADFDSGKIL